MKKGLKLTLMAVAVAALGMKVMAMAPVIGDIKSPVVGNAEQATEPNRFVYPDAMDLSALATDDNTPDSKNIKWSFYIAGTPAYQINGMDSLTSAEVAATSGVNPTTPGDATNGKMINARVVSPELNPDSNSQTITIRNKRLSPLGSSGTVTPAAGVQDTQVVTFFASDGTTFSQKDTVFYTENGGADRMSGPDQGTWTKVTDPPYTFDTTSQGWTWKTFGGVTSGNTGSLSFTVAAAGDNFAMWYSPWPCFVLGKDCVYQVRMKVAFTKTNNGDCPFWDLVIDNINNDGDKGSQLFGADYMVLDSETQGHANALTPTGSDIFVTWAPAPAGSAVWNAGLDAMTDEQKSVRLTFRIMDLASNLTTTGAKDEGTLKLDELEITKAPLSSVKVVSTPMDSPKITNSSFAMTSYTSVVPTWDNTNGTCTFVPNSETAKSDLVYFFPGDANADPNTPSTLTDSYIIPWTANKLYRLSVDLTAPAASDVTNSPDFYFLSFDTATQEGNMDTFVTNYRNNCGMPQTTKGTFSAFYNTNFGTKTTQAAYQKLRPRFSIGNNASFVSGNNTGKIMISKMVVDEVEIK